MEQIPHEFLRNVEGRHLAFSFVMIMQMVAGLKGSRPINSFFADHQRYSILKSSTRWLQVETSPAEIVVRGFQRGKVDLTVFSYN